MNDYAFTFLCVVNIYHYANECGYYVYIISHFAILPFNSVTDFEVIYDAHPLQSYGFISTLISNVFLRFVCVTCTA